MHQIIERLQQEGKAKDDRIKELSMVVLVHACGCSPACTPRLPGPGLGRAHIGYIPQGKWGKRGGNGGGEMGAIGEGGETSGNGGGNGGKRGKTGGGAWGETRKTGGQTRKHGGGGGGGKQGKTGPGRSGCSTGCTTRTVARDAPALGCVAICPPPPPAPWALIRQDSWGLLLPPSLWGARAGMHWKGGRYPPPLPGAPRLRPATDAKCQLQWHL